LSIQKVLPQSSKTASEIDINQEAEISKAIRIIGESASTREQLPAFLLHNDFACSANNKMLKK